MNKHGLLDFRLLKNALVMKEKKTNRKKELREKRNTTWSTKQKQKPSRQL